MQNKIGKVEKGAEFSTCRQYRFALWRIWDKTKPCVAFIGLNPSTADETRDDPTVNLCAGFATLLGYGGLYMLNLLAYKATDPNVMKAHPSPVSPEDEADKNDKYIQKYAEKSACIIAAWGNHGTHLNRSGEVRDLLCKFDIYCLGRNQTGEPCHPLYLPSDTSPVLLSSAAN